MYLSLTKLTHALLATMRIDLTNLAGEAGLLEMQDECLGCILHTSAWSSPMDCSSAMRPLDLRLQLPCGCSFRSPALDSSATVDPPLDSLAAVEPPLESPTSDTSLLLGGSESGREGEKSRARFRRGEVVKNGDFAWQRTRAKTVSEEREVPLFYNYFIRSWDPQYNI
jgi:hypothetical protein